MTFSNDKWQEFQKAKNIKLKKFEKSQKLIYLQNCVYKMSLLCV